MNTKNDGKNELTITMRPFETTKFQIYDDTIDLYCNFFKLETKYFESGTMKMSL